MNSGHELLGSPILIDTRALVIQRQKLMVSRRGVRRSLQSVGISSLDCTYHLPLNFSSTKVLKNNFGYSMIFFLSSWTV